MLNMRSTIPATATTAEMVAVENSDAQPPAPSMLERQMIHPVTLVPMSAPRMTEIACLNFIMPELTNPTTITDVAADDWMTPVTPAPSSSPRRGVLDRR